MIDSGVIFRQLKFTMHQIVSIDVQSGCQIIEKGRTDNIPSIYIGCLKEIWRYNAVSQKFRHLLQELQLFAQRNIS